MLVLDLRAVYVVRDCPDQVLTNDMLVLDLRAVYVVRDSPDQVLTNDFGSQLRANLLGVLWNVFEPIQTF